MGVQVPPFALRNSAKSHSEATSELIDAEVRRIVEECHREADRLLADHRDKLDAAQALLKEESLGLTEPSARNADSRVEAGKR